MLQPHARTLLFDILQPPENHTLDFALGTTYTLDLLALLTVPVAFTLLDVDDPEQLLDRESLALLESLRRYAARFAIFCQAGQIGVPRAQFPQFEFLEQVVVQCVPRVAGTSFHPKIWLLRFCNQAGQVTYRLACLTRNLTFDRCWDTALTLEGPLSERKRAFAANHPLGDFVASLPALVEQPLSRRLEQRITQIGEEVRRVDFRVPEGFETYHFHPLGIEGYRRLPFEDVDGRMFIMSPFVTEEGLRRIVRGRAGSILVSRPTTLNDGNGRAPEIERFFVLSDQINRQDSDEEGGSTARGLHAKCYIVDDGWKAHVWTGSANATAAGFNGNVEFLVELVGPKRRFGIDALLNNEDGNTSFVDLLEPFEPPAEPIEPDAADVRFEAVVDRIRASLARAGLRADVVGHDGDAYTVTLVAKAAVEPWSEEAVVYCRPVTLGSGSRLLFNGQEGGGTVFQHLSFEALSGFFAFEVVFAGPQPTWPAAFVLNVPLVGAPSDRRERLLRSVLQDRQRLIRFLLFLLADEGLDLAERLGAAMPVTAGTQTKTETDDTLLEAFVRSLARAPDRLDHVARLIDDLRRREDSVELFPAGFDEIWAPIWEARQRSRSCAG